MVTRVARMMALTVVEGKAYYSHDATCSVGLRSDHYFLPSLEKTERCTYIRQQESRYPSARRALNAL